MSTYSNEALTKLEGWTQAFKENGVIDEDNKVTIKEAFFTADAPILFPKVMSNVLREAAEPEYVITPLFDVVRTNNRLVEFPAVNAVTASLIPEGQEYPEQKLAFATHAEGKVTKKGVKVSFTDEVVNDSQWDIVALHVRAAGRAMARLKEQIALQRFQEAAHTVFDNGSSPVTTGRDIAGTLNDTLTWDDVIDMAAAMHADHHAPTDIVMNHLAWPLFAKSNDLGPLTGMQRLTRSGLASEQAAVNQTSPLGLNVLLSRFIPLDTTNSPAVTDIYVIDRSDVGANLVREEMSTEEFDDPSRDIRSLKLRERYDLVVYGDGEGIRVAKDVAVARSYDISVVNEVTIP